MKSILFPCERLVNMNNNSTSKIDKDEYPEITQADFDRAIFRQGLDPIEKKQRITIMLDPEIIHYFKAKAGKRGYQTLINDALKNLISFDFKGQEEGLEVLLRKIIREELKHPLA